MILFLALLSNALHGDGMFAGVPSDGIVTLSAYTTDDGIVILEMASDRPQSCRGDRHLTGQFLTMAGPRRVGPYALLPGAAYVLLGECPVHPDTWDARYVGDWLAA